MTAATTTSLFCDEPGCGQALQRHHESTDVARNNARAAGWVQAGQHDYCPAHATRMIGRNHP